MTGVIRLTNAYPAKFPPGAYTVTVTAFGPGGTDTATFTLTVITTLTLKSIPPKGK